MGKSDGKSAASLDICFKASTFYCLLSEPTEVIADE
jgi:hypothetical protein